MNLTLNDLPITSWAAQKTVDDWSDLLKNLLTLARNAQTTTDRQAVSQALADYCDQSYVPGQGPAIDQLDDVAAQAASALNHAGISGVLSKLKAAESAYDTFVNQLQLSNINLAQKTKTLRLEKATAAVDALTKAISSLKALGDVVDTKSETALLDAVTKVIADLKALQNSIQ